jgi:hypothetical protein
VAKGLGIGRTTALQKKNRGVRGIATGNAHRRIVPKLLHNSLVPHSSPKRHPHFALSTRAGTDTLSNLLRAVMDSDEEAVVIAIDGAGAFDHVQRRATFCKLLRGPDLSCLVPFVHLFYGSGAEYLWEYEEAMSEQFAKEVGEQGGRSCQHCLL